jgi:hypothetical protein
MIDDTLFRGAMLGFVLVIAIEVGRIRWRLKVIIDELQKRGGLK